VLYRMSGNSISASISRQEQGCLQVIEKAFNYAPQSSHYLKKYSVSNLYKYLTFRVLAGDLNREKGLTAARCFWNSVSNNPALLPQHPKLMSIVFVKILATILLPEQLVRVLLNKTKMSK
jgi:hypothetical protein